MARMARMARAGRLPRTLSPRFSAAIAAYSVSWTVTLKAMMACVQVEPHDVDAEAGKPVLLPRIQGARDPRRKWLSPERESHDCDYL